MTALLLLGAGMGRYGLADGMHEDVELAFEGAGFLRADRMRGFVAEEGEGGVLQALALPQQSRQLEAVHLLGEIVQRQGELDEMLEAALLAVILPACPERAQAGVERTLLRRLGYGGFVFHRERRIILNGRRLGNEKHEAEAIQASPRDDRN